jgi:hypothetical protein
MCMMVYVASDYPLPTLAWDEDRPGFYAEAVSERESSVRRQFKKPCVYYVGSHQGCGCGFDWDVFEGVAEDDAEFTDARDSRRRLSDFLAVGLQHQQEIELFACWDGNQSVEPEFRGKIHPADLLLDRTSFRENELLIIW